MVANHIRMEEEDEHDVAFWLGRPISERIAEVTRLRRSYYSWLDGVYPERIAKVVTHRKHVI